MTDVTEDKNMAQPAVPAEADQDQASDRPGRILGSAHLKIQTRQAQRLVYGRRRTNDKNQIIGMLQFGFFVQKIWAGAMMDDPYADWYLLKVHDALERGREELTEMKDEVNQLLKSVANMQIDIAHSVEPIMIPVQFPNPFGYMGAYLIADYDELTLGLLTVRHFGLMDRSTAEKQLARGASIVRRTFMSSAGWKNTGVTRADFFIPSVDGKSRADSSIASMGECPPKVLDRTLRSSMAPQIRHVTVDFDDLNQAVAPGAAPAEDKPEVQVSDEDLELVSDDADEPLDMEAAAAEAMAMVEESTEVEEAAEEEKPKATKAKAKTKTKAAE